MFEIRTLYHPDELHAAAAFQAEHQPEVRFDHAALVTLAHNGGLVLGAFAGDGQLAAVSISFLGTETRDPRRPAMANLKMVAAYWGAHPGVSWHDASYDLFVRQRDFAVQQGIRLITWTLDPLDSEQVYLSVRSLGAVTNRYIANYYGSNGAVNKDRLIMEWWTTNRRVEERLNGSRGPLSLRAYLGANTPIVNPTKSENGWAAPLAPTSGVSISGTMALLEISDNWRAMVAAAPDLAQDWREHLRVLAGRIFAEGYMVTDFLCEPHEGRQRCFYVLSRGSTTTFSAS